MSRIIKKINSIKKMAIFDDFTWDHSVIDKDNNPVEFRRINIIYGRNYSGKTTLSRLMRAMKTGEISDKFNSPLFTITFTDNSSITQSNITAHDKSIRVFNTDFIRHHLKFITNSDENILPFAILGDGNIKIEQDIKELEKELGLNKEGEETGLYEKIKNQKSICNTVTEELNNTKENLEKQLRRKATDRGVGIRYQAERFGDQNYTVIKLKSDITFIQSEEYKESTAEELNRYEQLITERSLQFIPDFHAPHINILTLANETKILVTKKTIQSDKIEELVNNAILNRWVSDGRGYHRNQYENCAFCGNTITQERWGKLDKHFDHESEKLEKEIDLLINKIEQEEKTISSALSIDKSLFYSRFHPELDSLEKILTDSIKKYLGYLNDLISQLKKRKENLFKVMSFSSIDINPNELKLAWQSYITIKQNSNDYSNSLKKDQEIARDCLRKKEVLDYITTIQYGNQLSSINQLNKKYSEACNLKKETSEIIQEKEEQLSNKKRELNDEGKGAKKVNEYMNNFFGHHYLSLEAVKNDIQGDLKQIYFEVMRDGKKAHHMSEGECSLLAFCYFLAKLDDIDTKDTKPIIWIDDPISSLDDNHTFLSIV